MIPKNISQKHILNAIDRIKKEGYPSKEESKDYDLLFHNKRYPPKVVIRYANEFTNGTENLKFLGGEIHTNNFLKKKGFIIINKNSKVFNDFFNSEEIKYLHKYNGVSYNKNNSAHKKLLKILKKSLRPKTEYWANSVCPDGYEVFMSNSPLKQHYKCMKIRGYTWARIYKKGDKDKYIFFTVGVHADKNIKKAGIAYKLDCQWENYRHLSKEQVDIAQYIIDKGSAGWEEILLKDFKNYNWEKLFKETKDFINNNEYLYDEIIDNVWSRKKQPLQLMEKPKPSKETKKQRIPLIGKETSVLGKQYLENKDLGNAGEELAIEYEKNKLKSLGLSNKIKEIEKMGIGCDIISFNKNGEKIYIEVKTTEHSEDTPFIMTANEYAVMNDKKEKYKIYRLYNYDKKNKTAKFYIIEGNVKKQLYFVSSQYEVTLK